jgi:transitional endoplasmic reticulum ATPase
MSDKEVTKPYGLKNGTTLEEYPVVVVRSGTKVAVAKDLLGILQEVKRRMEYEETVTSISERFDVFPWDGAYALQEVLTRRYGWVNGVPTPNFFGSEPPQMIDVEVAPGIHKKVPSGRMSLPGIDGWLQTAAPRVKGKRVGFALGAQVKRKHEEAMAELFQEVREQLKAASIYRGQALRIRFRDDDNDVLAIPELALLDTAGISHDELVFSAAVEAAIETNIFTPLSRHQELARFGIPFKRGVLLAGTFGVGKTLAARVASRVAVEAGVTYIYCKRAAELADAVEFARQYQPAAVFCEDIDRAMAGERDEEMDELLNVLDGIDSKHTQVMVVLTTNAVERINPANLRPGRLDAVISVEKPDTAARVRLLQKYGAGVIAPKADLAKAAKELEGAIPAVVAEVVQRAKLSQLKFAPAGATSLQVTEQALVEAAETMKMQLQLLNGPVSGPNGHATLDSALQRHLGAMVEDIHGKLKGELDSRE